MARWDSAREGVAGIGMADGKWQMTNSRQEALFRALGCGFADVRQIAVGFEGFGMDFVKAWDAVVPFQQCCRAADALDRVGIHLPHGIEHWVIMCVEDVALVFR